MSPLIQRLQRKITSRGLILSLIFLAFGGIVAITLSLASEEPPACTWHEAIDSGINNFLEKDPPAPVEDVPFFDRNGDEVRLSDYKGTPLVMNFWATWCPPCVAEMPALDRLKGLLADSGIDVLAIDEDRIVLDLERIAWQSDDAFDEVRLGCSQANRLEKVARNLGDQRFLFECLRLENDDITPPWISDAIGHLVDYDTVTDLEGFFHGARGDPEDLDEK